MNAISQMFEKLLNDQMSIINQKIKGSGFLEILKFKILENLPKKADEIISNNKIDLLNNYQYEDNQKMIIAEMLYYDSPKIILNTKTDKNLLIICLNGNIKIDIEDNLTQKFIPINLFTKTGVTVNKNTNINLNYNKNSIVLEIKHEDKNLDIEIEKDITI